MIGSTHVRVLSTLTVLGALTLSACDSSSPTEPPPGAEPESVEVSPGEAVLSSIGTTTQLAVEVLDEDGEVIEGAEVEWSTSDASVATVDEDGEVTAVGNGTATITAEAGDASGSAEITVQQEADQIEVDPSELTLAGVGAMAELSATVLDAGGTEIEGAEVTWSSSDEEVATVSESGVVEAVAAGTAVITAASGDASAEVEVDVTAGNGG
jgi:uncharacterized protein YjdB